MASKLGVNTKRGVKSIALMWNTSSETLLLGFNSH